MAGITQLARPQCTLRVSRSSRRVPAAARTTKMPTTRTTATASSPLAASSSSTSTPTTTIASRRLSSRRSVRRASSVVAATSPSGEQYVEDTSFRIEKVSFGKILTPVGVALLSYGFGAFFGLLPGADASPIMLVYGFPISLLGFALSYAQLEPVPCKTTAAAAAAREAGDATDIQKQLRDDVTRYRYGDEQHLEEALARVFQFGRPNGIQRRLAPKLVGIREEMMKAGGDGSPSSSAAAAAPAYTLVLEFDAKPEMTMEMWTDRRDKIEGFFGPGIVAAISDVTGSSRKPESPGGKAVDVFLTVDGSGAGKGGPEQKDVLPPLVPGAPARRQ